MSIFPIECRFDAYANPIDIIWITEKSRHSFGCRNLNRGEFPYIILGIRLIKPQDDVKNIFGFFIYTLVKKNYSVKHNGNFMLFSGGVAICRINPALPSNVPSARLGIPWMPGRSGFTWKENAPTAEGSFP